MQEKTMNRTRTLMLIALAGAACGGAGASAQSLFTTFTGTNGFEGNTFDLTAKKPITIIGWDCNIKNVLGTPRSETVTLYTRFGTSVGVETSSASWSYFAADAAVPNNGTGFASHANISGLELTPNQLRGMYVDLTSYNGTFNLLQYSDTSGPTGYSNNDLLLTSDAGMGSPAFTSLNTNRLWNGTITYKPTAACTRFTTNFTGANNFAGNTFNLVATNPITITSFDMNFLTAGSNKVVNVYYRLGPAQGFENNPAAWTLLGSDTKVISTGSGAPSRVHVGGLNMAPGQVYGIYVDVASYSTTDGVVYTTGASNYANADLRFSSNTGQGNPAFAGSIFPDRTWNGTIYYAPTPTISSLTTQFTSNNGLSGAMFDLTPQRDIEIDGFDTNITAGSTGDVVVYYRVGTSVGFEGTSSGWTLVGEDNAVGVNDTDIATPIRVRGARLKAGQKYGFYVSLTGTGTMRYTNGTTTYSNADLQFTPNGGIPLPLFTGGGFSGRIFNGNIYYHAATCYANCDGSTVQPVLSAADFVCFLNKFRASDPYANCDGSTGSPALSASDFVCFLNKFRAGCPG
jgi:hypothetical protein